MYLKGIVIAMRVRLKWRDSKLHILFKLSFASYLSSSLFADVSNRLHILACRTSNIHVVSCAVVRVRLQTGVAYSIMGRTYDL